VAQDFRQSVALAAKSVHSTDNRQPTNGKRQPTRTTPRNNNNNNNNNNKPVYSIEAGALTECRSAMRLYALLARLTVGVPASESAIVTGTLTKAAKASCTCAAVGLLLPDAGSDASRPPPTLPAASVYIAHEGLAPLGIPHSPVAIIA